MPDIEKYRSLHDMLEQRGVQLVAVSKQHSVEAIRDLYDAGHRHFGENRPQELCEKQRQLPDDIQWHMVGHLQRNKVKYMAAFVHLIHSVDRLRLLREINKQAAKHDRVIDCLLQLHIARESSKHGLSYADAETLLDEYAPFDDFPHVRITGIMGMATLTDDMERIQEEFKGLARFFEHARKAWFAGKSEFQYLSMGMSNDYRAALEAGSNMVRLGTVVFGPRGR